MNTWHEYYQEMGADEYIRNLAGHREFLAEIDSYKKGAKILEVGTGTGTMSVFLSCLGHEVTAIDNDPQVLDLARRHNEKFSGRVSFVEADAFSLPFEEATFDIIFHQGFFEHFSDEEIYRLTEEQLRVAKRLYVSIPNNTYPRLDFGNERLMSAREWSTILEKKFKVVKAESYSPKFLPRPYILRSRIQNLVVIERGE